MKYFAHIQTLCSFSPHFLQHFAYKLKITNPMFIFTVISRSISFTNLRLQTLCSCFERFLEYFAYKSTVTNPMFVVDSTLYKSEVPNLLCVFTAISMVSDTNQRLQTLCSFHAWFKLEVTNPMFIFTVISIAFRLQI